MDQIKDHLDGLRRATTSAPLGDHRVHCHEGILIEVTVSTLACEPNIAAARRTLRAFWIAARTPKMNRKEESIAVTNELAPFADLCGFDLTDRPL